MVTQPYLQKLNYSVEIKGQNPKWNIHRYYRSMNYETKMDLE